MTATVLPFARRNPDGAQEKAEVARTTGEIERRAFIRELREALASRVGKVKLLRKLRRDEDAVLLARRLGSDLERVKKMGRGALTKTLERAGLKLTTRARYALFAGDSVSEKRVRKLQPYVSLADAIADALEQDADLFLFERLDGINLEDTEQSSDDEATRLAFLIAQMANVVAEQTGLGDFFDLAARTPGTLDETGRHFRPSTMTALRDRAHEDGIDHWTEQQPIPSVPVCRILEQSISGRAAIGAWAKITPKNLQKIAEGTVEGKTAGKAVNVAINVWREIGLAVGERYQQGAIGPMFSGRAHIEVKFDDVVATPFYPWTLEHLIPDGTNGASDRPAVLVDGEHWTTCCLEPRFAEEFSWIWKEPSPVPGEPDYAVEHYYFSKHPVNAWTLRQLLDRSENGEVRAESLLPEVPAENRLDVYRFSGEIGRRFEDALYSGVLENALTADIIRLNDELNQYLVARRGRFAAQDEELLARWSAAGSTNNDNPEDS